MPDFLKALVLLFPVALAGSTQPAILPASRSKNKGWRSKNKGWQSDSLWLQCLWLCVRSEENKTSVLS